MQGEKPQQSIVKETKRIGVGTVIMLVVMLAVYAVLGKFTVGVLLGGLLGIPTGFAAALGLVCVFCGAVNCPIASVILSIELFGAGQLVYFALACGVAYMLSGYFGLYSSQKILYSKLRTEFINIHAK